jgi:hypothetical protein
MMSDIEVSNERDKRNGRFIAGNSGNGGRRPGARSRLGEAFLEDLRNSWNEVGAVALKRAAEEDPVGYCKIIAGLLPKTIDINATLDVTAFANNFRHALALLGNEAEPPRSRKPMKVINHNAG